MSELMGPAGPTMSDSRESLILQARTRGREITDPANWKDNLWKYNKLWIQRYMSSAFESVEQSVTLMRLA